jgi:hypothetical protein
MKFYRSYTYRMWENVREHLLISVLSGGFGLLMIVLGIQRIKTADLVLGIAFLAIAVMSIVVSSVLFPYGRGSIQIDNLSIRIVTNWGWFSYMLGIPTGVSLHKELTVHVELDMERMHLWQDGKHKVARLNGLSRSSKRKLLDIVRILSSKHKNIKLEISQEIWTEKRLWFGPGEAAKYPFQFETGEIIEASVPEGTERYFDLKLFLNEKNAARQDPVPAVWTAREYWGTPLVRWTVADSGPYLLVIQNRSMQRKNRIQLDLNRYYRNEHTASTDDANGPANATKRPVSESDK